MIMGSAGQVKADVNPAFGILGSIVGRVDQGPRRAGSPSEARAGRFCCEVGVGWRSGAETAIEARGPAAGQGGGGLSGRSRRSA